MTAFARILRRFSSIAVITTIALVTPHRAAEAGDVPATEGEVTALVAKGRSLIEQSRMNEADEAFAAAADAARALSNAALETAALKARFDTLGRTNEWLVLRGVAVRLLAVQSRAGDEEGATDTEQDLGSIEAMLGNFREADYHLRRAEGFWAEKGSVKQQAEVQINLAKVREMEGRVAEAWSIAEEARDTFHALKEPALESDALLCLAGIQILAVDFVAARALAEQGLALLGDSPDPSALAQARGLIAITDYLAGNFAEARRALLQVVDLYESAKDQSGVCQALLHLSAVDARDGKFESALVHARRAKARAGDNADLEGWAMESMGDAEVGLANHDAALKLFASALSVAERTQSPNLAIDVRRGMARACLARGDFEGAIDHARKACDVLESYAAGLDDQHRTSIRSSDLSEAYDLGIRAAVARKDPVAFTEFMERKRAGSLLQGLGGRRLLRGVGLPEALVTADQKAHEVLVAADIRFRALRDGGASLEEIRRAGAEKAAAERAYSDVIARIQRDAHREAAVSYPVNASLSELKAVVWPGEALVLYELLPDKLIALVVTSGDARLVDVGPRADVERAMAAVVDADGGVTGLTAEKIAAAAKAIFAPLGLPATVKRVLVSPDGILGNAPVTAMVAALEPADRSVALVPSGSAYRLLLEDRGRKGKRVLALGDPVYTTPGAAPAAVPSGLVASRGGSLTQLPGSRVEVLAITREGVDLRLLGNQATEAGMREALAKPPKGERWRSLHFACHGLLNRERPGLCALALTPGPGPLDDGLLTANEIFASRIPADLVVLSACSTALGRPDSGEGMLGFTRAFFNAGASRVVVSLWAVDDDATRELMTAFYAAIGAGAGHAAALRDAQAHVRAIEKWSHPQYWAAWVLWGLPD